MASEPRKITRADIMDLADYAKGRDQRRRDMRARKRSRRLAVGPDVTFYFENYDTMWMQIHEMLYVEGGGEQQIDDELEAYNPLIPDGRELVATMMIEIGDETRRRRVLARLGGIETAVSIGVGDENIRARPEQDIERTRDDGKTSAVHFLHFGFSEDQAARFRDPDNRVVLTIDHPEYGHSTVISGRVRAELAGDIDAPE